MLYSYASLYQYGSDSTNTNQTSSPDTDNGILYSYGKLYIYGESVDKDSKIKVERIPALVAQMVGKNGASVWQYDSADSPSEVRKSGYFANGVELGMKVGDIVTQIDTVGATVHHMYTVKSLNSDGSVNLSDGTAIN